MPTWFLYLCMAGVGLMGISSILDNINDALSEKTLLKRLFKAGAAMATPIVIGVVLLAAWPK